MLSRLVVQPFLLAMPADVRLAIKVLNNCSEFTWVLLFSKVSAQYIILVKCFPPSLPPFGDDVWDLLVLCHPRRCG